MPVEGVELARLSGNYSQGGSFAAPGRERHDWLLQLGRDLEAGDLASAVKDWTLFSEAAFVRTGSWDLQQLVEEMGQALKAGDLAWALQGYNTIAQSIGLPMLANPFRNMPVPAKIDLGVYEDNEEDSYTPKSGARAETLAVLQRVDEQNLIPAVGDYRQLRQSLAVVNPDLERRRQPREYPVPVTGETTESLWDAPKPFVRSGYEAYAYPPTLHPLPTSYEPREPEPKSNADSTLAMLVASILLLLVAAALSGVTLYNVWVLPAVAAFVLTVWTLWQTLRGRLQKV
jgi:hypothetical protein